MITLLTTPTAFEAAELRVEGDAYRHLFRARRVEAGEELRIVDGQGRARWGKVARVDRTSATVALGETAPEREPAFRLDLIVPTCRPERASWLVEKTTEVGVHAVRFVNMARAPREFGAGAMDRLTRVAEAALEQCHRSRLPEVTGPHAWKEVAGLAAGRPLVPGYGDKYGNRRRLERTAGGGERRAAGRPRGRARSRGAAGAAGRRLASRGSRGARPAPGDRRRGRGRFPSSRSPLKPRHRVPKLTGPKGSG